MSKTHQRNSQKTRVAPLLDFQRGLHTSNSHKKIKWDWMMCLSWVRTCFSRGKLQIFRLRSLRAKPTSGTAPDSAFSGGKCLEVSSKHRCCKKKINEESRPPESDFSSTIFIAKFSIFGIKSLSPNSPSGNYAYESVGALVSCNRKTISSSCGKKKIRSKNIF